MERGHSRKVLTTNDYAHKIVCNFAAERDYQPRIYLKKKKKYELSSRLQQMKLMNCWCNIVSRRAVAESFSASFVNLLIEIPVK